MTLSLKDRNGNILDERRGSFIQAVQKAVAHPAVASKVFSLSNSFLYYYSLAYQYSQMNADDKAEAMYQRAMSLNPAYTQKIPEYASFLLKQKKFGQALELLDRIKDDGNLKFQYCLLKGLALMGEEKYGEAINSLVQGNRIYNSDTGLLNSLGRAYYKTGQNENAINALNASLKLNPDQPDVKKLVLEIERKK